MFNNLPYEVDSQDYIAHVHATILDIQIMWSLFHNKTLNTYISADYNSDISSVR